MLFLSLPFCGKLGGHMLRMMASQEGMPESHVPPNTILPPPPKTKWTGMLGDL